MFSGIAHMRIKRKKKKENASHAASAAQPLTAQQRTQKAALYVVYIVRTLAYDVFRLSVLFVGMFKKVELTHSNSVYERLRVRKVALIRIPATQQQQQKDLFTYNITKLKIQSKRNKNEELIFHK